jgi:hypothetical protein
MNSNSSWPTLKRLYYTLKPFIPRRIQIALRRMRINYKLPLYRDVWPIDPKAGLPPEGWSGWPDNKQFALVLTHDVETRRGQEKCLSLSFLERSLGFRSSFNFVPRRYPGFPELRAHLVENGFEVGVHGLYHDGRYFESRAIFRKRAAKINDYLKEWNAVGFRMPSMEHNLLWIHDLHIRYDSSTFDTDPFEPNPEGVRTIFPFFVKGYSRSKGFVELPYTIPQDFTLFILMKQKNIDIWKRKLDWIVAHNGMALVIAHPDYMSFDGRFRTFEQYSWSHYAELLEYVKMEYAGMYWHVLPKEMAFFWESNFKSNSWTDDNRPRTKETDKKGADKSP